MCLPAAAVLAMTTIASTAYGVYTTRKNAINQEKALRNTQAIQAQQIHDQKSVQANDRIHQAQVERARLRAASAESGLSGISVTDVLDNVDFHAGIDVANIDKAEGNAQLASATELQGRLNAIPQPDYIAAGLQIASDAARAYGSPSPASDPNASGPPRYLAGS